MQQNGNSYLIAYYSSKTYTAQFTAGYLCVRIFIFTFIHLRQRLWDRYSIFIKALPLSPSVWFLYSAIKIEHFYSSNKPPTFHVRLLTFERWGNLFVTVSGYRKNQKNRTLRAQILDRIFILTSFFFHRSVTIKVTFNFWTISSKPSNHRNDDNDDGGGGGSMNS